MTRVGSAILQLLPVVAIASGGLTAKTRADDALPVLHVKPTEDFEVTGEGKAAAWNTVEWTPLVKRPNSHHDYETRVKVLYSKTGLYFLMDGTDAKVTATYTEDFDTLWKEDVYEVFLWTDEKHPIYFEYEISPLNRELPILVPNFGGNFLGWRPWMYDGSRKTRKAIHTEGGEAKSNAIIKGWRAEFFFPYELLNPLQNVPPTKGTKWRANFYRMDYDGGQSSSWDWARVGPSFHEYKKYGTLIFD
jgi:hypothetical protein